MGIELLAYVHKNAVTHLSHDIHTKLNSANHEKIYDQCKQDQSGESFQISHGDIVINRRFNEQGIDQ